MNVFQSWHSIHSPPPLGHILLCKQALHYKDNVALLQYTAEVESLDDDAKLYV